MAKTKRIIPWRTGHLHKNVDRVWQEASHHYVGGFQTIVEDGWLPVSD